MKKFFKSKVFTVIIAALFIFATIPAGLAIGRAFKGFDYALNASGPSNEAPDVKPDNPSDGEEPNVPDVEPDVPSEPDNPSNDREPDSDNMLELDTPLIPIDDLIN